MNISMKPISNFVNKVKNKIGGVIDYQRQAQRNFKNRKDNSNYYRGTKYWHNNKN